MNAKGFFEVTDLLSGEIVDVRYVFEIKDAVCKMFMYDGSDNDLGDMLNELDVRLRASLPYSEEAAALGISIKWVEGELL